MKSKALGLVVAGLFAAPTASAAVTVGDKEWRQVSDTLGLTWTEINSVCGSGVCSGGTGNLATLNGWNWATPEELRVLFDALIQPSVVNFPTLGSIPWLLVYESPNDPDIDYAIGPTTFTPTQVFADGSGERVQGWLRGSTGSATSGFNAALVDAYDPDLNDSALILVSSISNLSIPRGAWLYRPAAQSPEDQLINLIQVVVDLNVNAGIGNALDSKLQNALDALDRAKDGDTASAAGILYAFINSVEAQRDKQLTNEQADQLIASAQAVIDALSQT